MKPAIARLWSDHRAALIGFLVACVLTFFFAARFLFYTVYWSDPMHRDEPPQAWMTIGYVAHSWKVPTQTVLFALGMSQEPSHRTTLGELATSMGVTEEVLISRLQAALSKLPPEPKK